MTWNEMVRPNHPTQIVGNQQFVEDAGEWEKTGVYPSALLFLGGPGTGKTSAAIAVGKTMLGEAYNELNMMKGNASDDRGIGFIRDEVKRFARIKGYGAKRKVIFFDEADGLTPSAQDALRGIMEEYADKVLFILTANYGDKIRPAIKSRCTTYTFNRVSPTEGAKHLHRLTESCGAPIDWQPFYGDVVEWHDGDLRAAVNSLERIPKNADAIKQFTAKVNDDDDWWDFTVEHKYNELRKTLLTMLHDCSGIQEFMNRFQRSIRKHFDNSPDTTFAIMVVWGDMMGRIYEWGGSAEAFVEVLVAKLKKEMEKIE